MLGGAFTDIFDSQGNGTVIFRVDKLDSGRWPVQVELTPSLLRQ